MDRRVLFYYSKNGTLEIIPEEPPSHIASLVIIFFCFICGVVYNFIVTSAVYSSPKLSSSPFHQLIAQICINCLLDCLTNESLAFSTLLNNQISWCTFSSAVFYFFIVNHGAVVGLLCLEGFLALQDRPMSLAVCQFLILSSWVSALVVTLPTLLASEVHYFPNRMACGFVSETTWIAVFPSFSVLMSWLFLIRFITSKLKKHFKDLKHRKDLPLFPVATNSQSQSFHPPVVKSVKTQITASISFLYILLLFPLTVSVLVNLFVYPVFEPDPWTDPRNSENDVRSVSTHALEPLFTFSRYMYNVIVPIVVLSNDISVRLQSRRVFCCKSNAISDEDSNFKRMSNLHQVDSEVLEMSPVHLRTPVLFATSQGLHLRVPRVINPDLMANGSSLRLVSRFCDLSIQPSGSADPQLGEEETDYLDKGPGDRRNVRFSSKVYAISPMANTSSTSQSDTRVVLNPVFVKEDPNLENVGKTYNQL